MTMKPINSYQASYSADQSTKSSISLSTPIAQPSPASHLLLLHLLLLLLLLLLIIQHSPPFRDTSSKDR
jgi:hypothetical protein